MLSLGVKNAIYEMRRVRRSRYKRNKRALQKEVWPTYQGMFGEMITIRKKVFYNNRKFLTDVDLEMKNAA